MHVINFDISSIVALIVDPDLSQLLLVALTTGT